MTMHDESEPDAREMLDTDGKTVTEPSVLQARYDDILQNPCGPSASDSESAENVENPRMPFEPETRSGENVENPMMPFEPESRSGENVDNLSMPFEPESRSGENVQNPSGPSESEGGSSGENLHNLNGPCEPESRSDENLRNPCKSFGPDSSRSSKSGQADEKFQHSKTKPIKSSNDHDPIFRSAGRRHRHLSDSLLTEHSANEVKGKKLWDRREAMRQMVRNEEQKI